MSEKSENGSSVPPLPGDAATPQEETAPAEATETPVTDPTELQETTTTEAGAEEGETEVTKKDTVPPPADTQAVTADDTEPPGPGTSEHLDSPVPPENTTEEPDAPVAAPESSETPETPQGST